MKKVFYKSTALLLLIPSLFLFPLKSFAISSLNLNNTFLVSQQKAIINYEKSQPSSIINPVEDPNFNVMRSSDSAPSSAVYILIALLVAASIIPLATWFISKQQNS